MLENSPTLQSCFQGLQRSSPAVHEYRTARGEHCGRGYDRCVQILLPTVVAPEAHQNDRTYVYELRRILYGGRLNKQLLKTIEQWKLGGERLLARDNTVIIIAPHVVSGKLCSSISTASCMTNMVIFLSFSKLSQAG